MATNADSMIEYDLDEEVDRANEWDGSFSELEDLADTVRSAWKERFGSKLLNVSQKPSSPLRQGLTFTL